MSSFATVETGTRAGVPLAWRDSGGDGPPVLALHGLAGYGGEWAQTADWLSARARVIAPDARGHGASARFPDDVSRAATAEDAAFVITSLGLGPVVAVGQSLGGLTALALAARHPELVRALVLVEAGPSDGDRAAAAEAAAAVERGLSSWPVPFASRDEASGYFAARYASDRAGAVWAGGLELRDGGLWPRSDPGVMAHTLEAALAEPSWQEWEALRVPALVVRASGGDLDPAVAAAMLDRLPGSRLVEIDSPSHDVHLDQPRAWRRALEEFLDAPDGLLR